MEKKRANKIKREMRLKFSDENNGCNSLGECIIQVLGNNLN